MAASICRQPGYRSSVADDDATSVTCNATHVGLILRNLIGNADKYSPPDQPIEVLLEECDEEFVISVRDHGPGVPPAERDLVFQPFYRSKRTADVNGMGIGLAVCQKLINLDGGRIWLRDREGGGCEVSFSLPSVLASDLAEDDLALHGSLANPTPA